MCTWLCILKSGALVCQTWLMTGWWKVWTQLWLDFHLERTGWLINIPVDLEQVFSEADTQLRKPLQMTSL
jgi:hypothetical protein